MCNVIDRHNYSDDAKQEAAKGRFFLNGNGNGRTWEWLWRGLTILFLPWAAWITLTIMEIRTSVAVIEGNRFTSRDAYQMMQVLDDKADKEDVPPEWFKDEVDELSDRLDRHIEDANVQ
jgi:hypothetical protein